MAPASPSMPTTALPRLPYPVPQDAVRSATMRAIRRTDTKPELIVRSGLHRLGFRFRKDYPIQAESRKVRVDIAFTRRRLAIFIDGCFWHQCPEHGTVPKTNRGYWVPKLEQNARRDARVTRELEEAGWSVLRIWEHVPPEDAIAAIAAAVARTSAPAQSEAAA